MKTNLTKQKMLRGEPALGYSAKLGSPVAAEFLSNCGVDFVMIDGQHGSWGADSLIQGLQAVCAGPAMPFARVAYNSFTLIGQLLDAGALGVIVPMVDTLEQARAVAKACRYPPVAERSFGFGRALAYGDDYTDCINDELFVAVQIESALAVKNAEAILAVPGIDGCMIGPQDLALSLGFHPREIPKRDEHARALERVVQACRNTGKIPGIDVGAPDTAAQRVQQGFRFVPMGSDVRFLNGATIAGLKQVRQAIASA
jgi:4-hydroxy-2-oxoheptanedioate aldolase